MIPSLLQIPSAVSDSKLHSVLPNNGKGDFQFERSTGATRINRDGLIEEVGYFSSELVQNGNFSELGSELVTNGDFATDSNWIKQDGWSIASGSANCNDSIGYRSISQNSLVSPIGKTYKVTYEVSDYVSGEVRCILGGFTLGQIISSNGLVTEYLTVSNASSNTFVYLETRGSGFIGSIDNVSVKQVDPNDRWTLGTGWSYGDGKAKASGVSGSNNLTQSSILTVGKSYKITITVSEYVSGSVEVSAGASPRGSMNANGTYTFIQTATPNTSFYIISQVFNGAVDNVSVVEVQGDRPRLSYDITNGVVEDQPHLLLEPSATNLVTFSEDFSQWNTFNLTAESNTAINPKGTSGCYRIFVDNTSNSNLFLSTASIGTSYTISIYAKSNNANKDNFRLRIGDSRSSVFTATSDWQRFTYSATATGSNTFAVAIFTSSGTVSSDILIFGAQVETTAYATSYIPTAGTTITRAAETCNNSKPSVNSTEGVLYAEFAALADDGTMRQITLSDGTTSNTIRIQLEQSVSNAIWGILTSGGANQAILQYTSSDITNNTKVALKYKANDFAFYIDGVKVATDTSGTTFSSGVITQVQFDRGDGANDFYGKVKGLAVYNEALSESQLMQLTGVTASSIYSNFVTRTASFTVEALNEVKKVIDNL